MYIKVFRYNEASETDRRLLGDLLRCVWEDTDSREIHPKEMDAMSFCAVSVHQIIGYVGVIRWDIQVEDKIFKMCGLSCVCTHPLFRKKGIAAALVKRATDWIVNNPALDLGLFTCSLENVPFYENIGLWQRSHGLVLQESEREGALRSDLLHLDVFKLLISTKAKACLHCFENTTVNLNFPEGKFV